MFHDDSTVEGREGMEEIMRKLQMTMGTRTYQASRLWAKARLK